MKESTIYVALKKFQVCPGGTDSNWILRLKTQFSSASRRETADIKEQAVSLSPPGWCHVSASLTM